MKQGRASSSKMGSTKVEPTSHAVPPAYPSLLGMQRGNHAMDCEGTVRVQKIPMYAGRGLEAPMKKVTTHKAGSQGHHK